MDSNKLNAREVLFIQALDGCVPHRDLYKRLSNYMANSTVYGVARNLESAGLVVQSTGDFGKEYSLTYLGEEYKANPTRKLSKGAFPYKLVKSVKASAKKAKKVKEAEVIVEASYVYRVSVGEEEFYIRATSIDKLLSRLVDKDYDLEGTLESLSIERLDIL